MGVAAARRYLWNPCHLCVIRGRKEVRGSEAHRNKDFGETEEIVGFTGAGWR